jgi:hypothetical protein
MPVHLISTFETEERGCPLFDGTSHRELEGVEARESVTPARLANILLTVLTLNRVRVLRLALD